MRSNPINQDFIQHSIIVALHLVPGGGGMQKQGWRDAENIVFSFIPQITQRLTSTASSARKTNEIKCTIFPDKIEMVFSIVRR